MSLPTTAAAVAATVQLAQELGLPADRPRVIAEGYSVRVRLEPAPVVSRVFTLGLTLRHEPGPWLQREVDVVRHLSTRGAPVVPVWEQAGPYLVDGLHISLWTWTDELPGTVSQTEFGAMLRALHDKLADYPEPLPILVGPLTDIEAALALSDNEILHRAAAELVPLARSWPVQPLHGDAHTGNVMITETGPRWIDFEDVCLGPVEWDLASRTLTDETVRAYGAQIDRQRLADCRDLRRLQILAGVLTDDLQDATLYDELIAALARRSR